MIKLNWSLFILFLIQQCFAQEMLSNPRCNHYHERGTCENSFEIKWYYDRFDHRCRRFHYGGCQGNDNRFDSLTECEQSCHFDPQIDETSSRRCFQLHDPGTCWGNFERWYFDSNLKRCVCSWWSGCGGNSNRFYSYPHCMQICGEHAVDSNIQDNPAPEDVVYESPMQRLSAPQQIPVQNFNKQATQVFARPKDTQPLGGGILYPSHVSTPQHPPIYDDPDVFEIQPVFEEDDDDIEDDNIEEFETTAYRNPILSREWSAKTETRFFPNLGLRNRTFTGFPIPTPVSTLQPLWAQESTLVPEVVTTPKPTFVPKPPSSPKPTPITDNEADNGMLLNLRPPSEFQSKTKKRNVEAEVVETNFRTIRQSRRSSGTTMPQHIVEEYETEFHKQSPTRKRENYESYETPIRPNFPQSPPQVGYAQAASSRNPRTRYHEEAETQFIRHSYINPPLFPGYPILKSVNSEGHRIPQPVPQGLINQLIAQHLALRERLGQTQKVPVIEVQRAPSVKHSVEVRETPYRRLPGVQSAAETARAMSYAEKRRRWKEEMKKKLQKQKIPPRQIFRPVATGKTNKYYVTYSPYYRLYQVSRQTPRKFNITDKTDKVSITSTTTSSPLEVASPEPPKTESPSSMTPKPSTTTSTTTTTTTTTVPKIVSLKVEPISPNSSNKMQVRVAAIKPTPEIKGKQLLYMDDEDDEWKVEEEDYYVDDNGQTIEKVIKNEKTATSTASPPQPVQTTSTAVLDDGIVAIVFPIGQKTDQLQTTMASAPLITSIKRPIEQVTPGADYVLPEAPSDKQDYTDYGHSEEDLFFWKPEFEQRRTRIDPSSSTIQSATETFNEELPANHKNDNDAFEITVHNPNKKL